MGTSGMRHLTATLRPELSQALRQFDFAFGVAAGVGIAVLASRDPASALRIGSTAAAFVGVVIGAVLAGASIQAAFMDQEFLRKLRAINRNPVRYLTPYLFTASTGVVAMVALLALSGCSVKTAGWLTVSLSGVAGLLTVWSILSVLPCLAMLVQFIGLKADAADVPDNSED